MKKLWLGTAVLVLLAAMLGGCGSGAEETKTLEAPDGSVQIDTPDGWEEDTSQEMPDYMVLSIGDGTGAFAQISYYPDDGSGDTAEELAQTLIDTYYMENVIGEIEEAEIEGAEACYFEYSMVEEGVDGNNHNYHGYEYLIGFGLNIIEVDIFYSQSTLEGKLFSPSDDQLAQLRSIAETARIRE